ncbi:MAG TPA: hypothetical protein VFS08_10625 [Gemmatimonadaceae bacterium]|nr:hypothetical protein [Gemmatimonadaceae bacterium]
MTTTPVRTAAAVAAAAALLALPGRAAAQAGTAVTAPILLRIPAGVRAASLGGAGAAVTDAEAIFHDPAQLAQARGVAMGVQRYGGGATLGSVAIALPFAPGGLGVGVQYLDYEARCLVCGGAIPESERELARGGDLPASALVASLGFGRTLSGVRVGAAAKWVEQRIPEARGGAAAVDVGVGYDVGPVALAVAARNLGGRLSDGLPRGRRELPRSATAGAALDELPVGPLDLSAAADVTVYDGGWVTAGGGVEVGYTPLEGYTYAGRVGVRHVPHGGVGPVTLGLALTRDRIGVEYAFEPLDGPGAVHRIGVRLRP